MMAQSTAGQIRVDSDRMQYKELMTRHQDLQQNKDKVEGTLISILLLTQITELKMLVDIGRPGHRLYDVVLALLVASVGALILVGLIVLYVGNLRYYRQRRRKSSACCRAAGSSAAGQLSRCAACCPLRRRGAARQSAVASSRDKRIKDTYVCVPLGVATGSTTADGGTRSAVTVLDESSGSTATMAVVGCCPTVGEWPDGGVREADRSAGPSTTSPGAVADVSYERLELLDAAVDEARAKLAAVTARLAALRADPDRDGRFDETTEANEATFTAWRRQKETAEAELAVVEARRQRALARLHAAEDSEERAVFRSVVFWQHFTMYVLYFVCLMNIFITAFGIYSSSGTGNGTTSSTGFVGSGQDVSVP